MCLIRGHLSEQSFYISTQNCCWLIRHTGCTQPGPFSPLWLQTDCLRSDPMSPGINWVINSWTGISICLLEPSQSRSCVVNNQSVNSHTRLQFNFQGLFPNLRENFKSHHFRIASVVFIELHLAKHLPVKSVWNKRRLAEKLLVVKYVWKTCFVDGCLESTYGGWITL